MSNPLLPCDALNALAPIPGLEYAELRGKFRFTTFEFAADFVADLIGKGALVLGAALTSATDAEMTAGTITERRVMSPAQIALAIQHLAPAPDLSAYVTGAALTTTLGGYATTAAVTTAIATAVSSVYRFKGDLSCAGNPNYPAAVVGEVYRVSAAGKIGGNAGAVVSVGDQLICKADNAGGDQATAGASWTIAEGNIPGLSAYGLTLISAGTAGAARSTLGLGNAALGTMNTANQCATTEQVVTGSDPRLKILDLAEGQLDATVDGFPGTNASVQINIEAIRNHLETNTDPTGHGATFGFNFNAGSVVFELDYDESGAEAGGVPLDFTYLGNTTAWGNKMMDACNASGLLTAFFDSSSNVLSVGTLEQSAAATITYFDAGSSYNGFSGSGTDGQSSYPGGQFMSITPATGERFLLQGAWLRNTSGWLNNTGGDSDYVDVGYRSPAGDWYSIATFNWANDNDFKFSTRWVNLLEFMDKTDPYALQYLLAGPPSNDCALEVRFRNRAVFYGSGSMQAYCRFYRQATS